MILKLFKSNTIVAGVLSLVLLILLWFKSFRVNDAFAFLDFGLLYHFKSEIITLPNWVLILSGIVIVLITASILNITINQDEFFDKNTFLPFTLYVLLISVSVDFNNFNPIIISNLFLILFLRWAFKIRRQTDAREIMFNASFLLSCATLFFPVYSPFLLSPFVLLIIFRPFVWREWVLAGLGLFIPAAFYAYLMYYLGFPFESNTYNESFWQLLNLDYIQSAKQYTIVFIYGLLSMFSFYVAYKKMNKGSLRLRMLMRFLAYIFFTSLILSFVLFFKSNLFLIVAALPLTLFFSYYFYHSKAFWGNLNFYILLMGILIRLYFV